MVRLQVYARAVGGAGGDKSGGLGGGGGTSCGGTDSFRGGARSPGLPSPNTLLLRSLSSSSAISRVSSHFSHFNNNAPAVELQLPVNFRRRGAGAGDGDEATHAFGGGGAGDCRNYGGPLDARAARAKYLPTGGGGATAAENAARAGKSKAQWGWGAGKSIFGKRLTAEGKRPGQAEPEAQPDPPPAVVTTTSDTTSNSLAAAAVEVAHAASHALKAADTKTQQQGGGRRLATDTGGTYREPGGERGRGTRSAAEQRSGLDRDRRRDAGAGGGGADLRVRERRPRQSRSVDSPGRVAKGVVPATADAAVEAAHGFFSVPAASHADPRETTVSGGGKPLQQRQRSVSNENEESARYDRREYYDPEHRLGSSSAERKPAGGGHRGKERGGGETRSDAKKRRSPTPAGTRRERESSQRPSRSSGRTRTRSEERLSRRGEGKQWSDLANPRPPLPYPSPAQEAAGPSGGGGGAPVRRTGGGSGGISAASPANSSNYTSDDKSRASRGMDDNSSSAGWGTSSLAGWGETMAAEAEAEVLGRSNRRGDRRSGGTAKGDRVEEAPADSTLRGQPERTRLHQMVAALTDLCMYLVGVSPLSMEDCPTMLELLPNDDDDWDEVGGDDASWYGRGRVGVLCCEACKSECGMWFGETVGGRGKPIIGALYSLCAPRRPLAAGSVWHLPCPALLSSCIPTPCCPLVSCCACVQQDDTFDDSSIFSYGSVGSSITNGGARGRLPSSPSTLGAAEQSDDDLDDEDLGGRWGNTGVVIGGGQKLGGKSAQVRGCRPFSLTSIQWGSRQSRGVCSNRAELSQAE